MTTIDMLVPELPEAPPPADLRMAPREVVAPGARLLLIENGKPRATELLHMIADRLDERLDLGDVELYAKGSASRVIDQDEARELAERSDLVIAGLGDCGACSACSLGDALRMEGAGVPSTVLISDVFVGHVASFAVTMGMPGYHTAVVPHPVSSKDDEQLAAYADAVVEQVLDQLTAADDRSMASAPA